MFTLHLHITHPNRKSQSLASLSTKTRQVQTLPSPEHTPQRRNSTATLFPNHNTPSNSSTDRMSSSRRYGSRSGGYDPYDSPADIFGDPFSSSSSSRRRTTDRTASPLSRGPSPGSLAYDDIRGTTRSPFSRGPSPRSRVYEGMGEGSRSSRSRPIFSDPFSLGGGSSSSRSRDRDFFGGPAPPRQSSRPIFGDPFGSDPFASSSRRPLPSEDRDPFARPPPRRREAYDHSNNADDFYDPFAGALGTGGGQRHSHGHYDPDLPPYRTASAYARSSSTMRPPDYDFPSRMNRSSRDPPGYSSYSGRGGQDSMQFPPSRSSRDYYRTEERRPSRHFYGK